MPETGSFSHRDEEGEKRLSICICSSMLNLSVEVEYSRMRGSEKQNRLGGREKEWEAVSSIQPFHHLLSCETVPLLGFSDANCSEESVLLSAVFWLPLWEDLRQNRVGNFCTILTLFLPEKSSKLLFLVLKSKPHEKLPLSTSWALMLLLIWVQRLWPKLESKEHSQTCHLISSWLQLLSSISIQT